MRHTERLAATMLVAALGVLAAGTATATAAPRAFFGVVSVNQPIPSEFNTLGRGRVGTFRSLLVWETVEPTPGVRDWASFDAIVENSALNGIRVLPTVFGSPAFAAAKPQYPPRSPVALAAWSSFISDAVHRYGAGGTFWQQFATAHPGVAALPITDWQIWNEVSSPTYWLPHPNGRQYAAFIKATAPAIRAADPAARVVLAGLFPHPTITGTVPIGKFLGAFYKVRGIKSFFDAAAVHPYARRPADPLKTVKDVRKLLTANRDGKTPIWVTEIGWATSGARTPYTTSLAGQARNLRVSFGQLSKAAKKLKIAGVIWYALRDTADLSTWTTRTGLFSQGGTPKPAWNSFVRFTGGSP